MRRTRILTLKKDHLVELTGDQLTGVAGGVRRTLQVECVSGIVRCTSGLTDGCVALTEDCFTHYSFWTC